MTDDRLLSVYIHWPFCQAKCPYCDFNSHVSASVDHNAWKDAMVKEIYRYKEELPEAVVSSIFFGGGTPSLMEPSTVEGIMNSVFACWPSVNDLEVTLEANPTSSDASRFDAFRTAGVNRISVGLQAMNDPDLKALGRLHSAQEGIDAFEKARSIFDRASFDLIYARQNQSLDAWSDELRHALSLGPDHVSLYQLTIEDGTAFGQRHDRGLLKGLPSDDLAADMFELTNEVCEAAGLPAYEISNYARPGAESRHNLTYWSTGNWIGIGPGAHGRFSKDGSRIATEAIRSPAQWLKGVLVAGEFEERHVVPEEDWLNEKILMGLRLTDGVDIGSHIHELSDKVIHINSLTDYELLCLEGGRLRLTSSGRPLLNSVLTVLLS